VSRRDFVGDLLKQIKISSEIRLRAEQSLIDPRKELTAIEKEHRYQKAVENLIQILAIAATGELDDVIKSITLTAGSCGEYQIRSENFEEAMPPGLDEYLKARDAQEKRKE